MFYLISILIIYIVFGAAEGPLVFAEDQNRGSSNVVGTVEDKPSWYAVISSAQRGKKLYVKGDIFSSDTDVAKSLRIVETGQDSLLLEDVASKNKIMLSPGDRIPIEGADMVFEKAVEASVVEYRYKPSSRLTKAQAEDFTVKGLSTKRVVLEKNYNKPNELSQKEKEIFDSPRDAGMNKKIIIADLFKKIEVKKIGEDVWALNRHAEPAVANTGSAIISAIRMVEPRYRFGEGPSLRFNSDLGTVVLNRDGFLVQNIAIAKLGEDFGIREGDLIKSVNGHPVNNLLGIYRAFESVASDRATKLVSISIIRSGKAKTLVYKIR